MIAKNDDIYESFKFSDRFGNCLTGYRTKEGTAGFNDRPPIIFVTAIGLGNKISVPLAEALSDRNQFYTWDMRGLPGDGELADEDFTTTTYVEELKSLVDHIGAEKVIVIGYCSGCQVATIFTYLYPEFIAKTLCLNGHYNMKDVEETPARRAMGVAVKKVLESPKDSDNFIRLFIATSFEKDVLGQMSEDLRDCIHSRAFDSPSGMKVYFRMLNAFRENGISEMGSSIETKFILFGSENDHMCSPKQSVAFSKLLKNSSCHIFPELDHFALFTDQGFRENVKSCLGA